MSAPILIFGARGQVGQEVLALAKARGRSVVGVARPEVDIRDSRGVYRAIETVRPRLVVNAAAYTAVDRAESEPEEATSINRMGASIVAKAAALSRVPLLHLSTDYVFDGCKESPYVESDRPNPMGVYGRTKAEGETEVQAAHAQSIILRTSWVYGPHGANFLKTILRLAQERDALRVVADQRGCPTSTLDIAHAILAVEDALMERRDVFGLYHFAGTGVATWHEFADEIVRVQETATGKRPVVTPITTAEYPTPAKRPANSVLTSDRFVQVFGYRATPWRDRVLEVWKAIAGQGAER